MDRKQFFRLAWVLTLLLSLTLGCRIVDQAGELIAIATDLDVEGLATDIDVEGLATEFEGLATEIDIEGLVTEIDFDEMATQMQSMATDIAPLVTEMGSMLTDLPGFDGTLIAVSTPSGFPADIPVMEGQKLSMTGDASRLEYTVDVDANVAVDFYRREMAARGWVAGSALVQDEVTTLMFQLGNRRATVKIAEDFFFGVTITITVEG